MEFFLAQFSLDDNEIKRLRKMGQLERKQRKLGFTKIAGVDEAGRGPLAGPVVAAACLLPKNFKPAGINDSKVLDAKQREYFYEIITSHKEICYNIAVVNVDTINKLNIFHASLLAMKEAIEGLEEKAEFILVDGKHLPNVDIPGEKVVKGDSKSISIAAASILAKFARDQIMEEAHQCYPMYGFNKHKGYTTKMHLQALQQHGACPLHRDFEPVRLVKNGLPEELQKQESLSLKEK